MALEGTLRDFSLADILQLIGIQKKTGVLVLRDAEEVVRVSFQNGMIVASEHETEQLETRLGNVLVKKGVVTTEQLQKALEIQSESLQRLGQVMIENSLIGASDLRDALRNQVLQTIYGLFRWKNGHYHFAPQGMVDYDSDNLEPISTESILMEGLRMLDEWPLIERVIPNGDIIFRQTEKAASVRDTLASSFDEALFDDENGSVKLPHEQEYVLQLVDGVSAVKEIAERSKLLEFETYRALYDLMDGAFIEKSEYRLPSFTDYQHFAEERKEHAVPAAVLIGLILGITFLFSFRGPFNDSFPSFDGLHPGTDLEKMMEYGRLNRVKANEMKRMMNSHYAVRPANLITVGDDLYVMPGKYGLRIPVSYHWPVRKSPVENEADLPE